MLNFIRTFKKHPEECGEMKVAEKDVTVTPDLDHLLGLISELFYPQYKRLKQVSIIRYNMTSSVIHFYLNKSDKNPR